MAKTAVTYDSIMADIRKGQFAPVYLLMGEEAYYIDKITEAIAETALQPEERDFNQTIVFGQDVKDGDVVDLAKRYPMMAERQVVIVKEAQGVKNYDRLEKYLEHPLMSTVLVFCHKGGKIDGRRKVVTNAAKVGVVFESNKKRDYELPTFIKGYLKDRNATIDDKATQMMADFIGPDLNRMTSELDKLLIGMGEKDRRVTPELVEKKIGVSKDYNPFELRSALIEGDVVKANRIVNYFNSNTRTASIYQLLPLVFQYFQNLMIAWYAPERNNPKALAAHLGLKSDWGTKEYIAGMRRFSARKTMDIISKFRETDAKLKGLDNGGTSPGDLLRELVYFIMH